MSVLIVVLPALILPLRLFVYYVFKDAFQMSRFENVTLHSFVSVMTDHFLWFACFEVIYAYVVYRYTRDFFATAVVAGLFLTVGLSDMLIYTFELPFSTPLNSVIFGGSVWATVIWHALFLAAMMRWAIAHRRSYSERACWHCAYDLTAHDPASSCPECGNAIPLEHPLHSRKSSNE